MARTEPCGECDGCKAKKRCFRILSLSAKDEAALRSLFDAGFGQHEGVFQMTRAATVEQIAKENAEPTTKGTCPSCRGVMHLETYLAEFLKLRAAKWPECSECQGVRAA